MAHLDKSLDCHDLDQLVVDCRWLYPKFNQVSLVSSYKAPVLASFFFPNIPGTRCPRSQIGRYYSTTMKMSQDSLAWTMRTFLQHKSHKNTASNHQTVSLLLDTSIFGRFLTSGFSKWQRQRLWSRHHLSCQWGSHLAARGWICFIFLECAEQKKQTS